MKSMDEHGLISITVHGLGEVSKNEAFNQILLYIFVAGFFFIGVFVVKDIMKSKELICKKEGETCDEVYCYKLKEHDFKYGIGILLLLMIFICTLTLGNNNTVMDYISFAGTVSSLILSILAIMMTLLSESKVEETKTRLANLVDMIGRASTDINKQVNKNMMIQKSLEERFPVYQKILEKQDLLIEKIKSIEEHTQNIEKGIQKSNLKGRSWNSIKKMDIKNERDNNG